MSNLLEQASLVLIPSGYKEDVVYSEIPINGAGDMSFTRASNGTRINSQGLVEVCPWNLVQYSEEFNNAIWDKLGATISANATTAPNGTTTADNLIPSNGTQISWALQNFSSVAGETYTFSIYVKSSDFSFVQITGSTGFNTEYQNYNIANGTLASGSGGVATITSVGNGWFRIDYSLACISTGSSNRFIFTIQNSGTSGRLDSCTGNGTKFVSLWGAQLNIGSTAKPYFPTTDRLNVPRLTYQNGGGGCPSLLLEKQSTNLILQSEVFDNASWTKAAVSVTANNITSPDGTQNADLLTTTSASICGAYQLISTGSGTFSFSIFAKKGNNNYLALNAQASSANNCTAIFDLSDGTLGEYQTKGTTAYVSHKIENLGNDWYRCTMVLTATSSAYFFPMFAPLKTGNTFTSSGEVSVASGKTLYLWGCQLEASSYPTSYIPTTSSSATRVADACSKTGISSLIGQTEGVLFVDFQFQQYDGQPKWVAFLGAGASYIGVYTNSSSKFVCEISNSGANQFINDSYTFAINQRYKIALAYKANDFVLYINGTQVATDSSGTVPSTSQLSLQYNTTPDNLTSRTYNQVVVFPTRLTNAELQALTTL